MAEIVVAVATAAGIRAAVAAARARAAVAGEVAIDIRRKIIAIQCDSRGNRAGRRRGSFPISIEPIRHVGSVDKFHFEFLDGDVA